MVLARLLSVFYIILFVGGCQSVVSDSSKTELLSGAWVREIRDGQGLEGLYFDDEGKLGLLGIHSMHGQEWQLQGNQLQVSTNTFRYPEPFRSQLELSLLGNDQLQLTGNGYLAGSYTRSDQAFALEGNIGGEGGWEIPPDTRMVVQLRAQGPNSGKPGLVAQQVDQLQATAFPLKFRIYGLWQDVAPGTDGVVSVKLIAANQVIYQAEASYLADRGKERFIRDLKAEKIAAFQAVVEEGLNPPVTFDNEQSGQVLKLRQDGIFQWAETANGEKLAEWGHWHYVGNGNEISLAGGREADRRFRVIKGSTLVQLNNEGGSLPAPQKLSKTQNTPEFPHVGRLRGLYRYFADAAIFTECESGLQLPVKANRAALALEKEYLAKRAGSDQPLLVNVMAATGLQPAMEGNELESVLVVEKLLSSWPGESCQLPASYSLTGTNWQLVELQGRAINPQLPRGLPSLQLDDTQQRATGFGGCNRFFGSYQYKNRKLSFGQFGSTMMACQDIGQLERDYFKMLSAASKLYLQGGSLILSDEMGRPLARFEALAEKQ